MKDPVAPINECQRVIQRYTHILKMQMSQNLISSLTRILYLVVCYTCVSICLFVIIFSYTKIIIISINNNTIIIITIIITFIITIITIILTPKMFLHLGVDLLYSWHCQSAPYIWTAGWTPLNISSSSSSTLLSSSSLKVITISSSSLSSHHYLVIINIHIIHVIIIIIALQ